MQTTPYIERRRASIIARLPADSEYAVDALLAREQGWSDMQRRWLVQYSAKFSMNELGILFGKNRNSMRYTLNKLGLLVEQRAKGRPVGGSMAVQHAVKAHFSAKNPPPPEPDQEPPQTLGKYWDTRNDYSQARAKAATPQFRESLRAYTPTPEDESAGWVVNNFMLHKMGLRALKGDGCRFIEGDTHEPGWSYCGARCVHASPYCETHHLRCHPVPKKEEPADE